MTSSTCKRCGQRADVYSGVKHGQLYSDLCERCVGALSSAEFSREYDRKFQRREYAKDIVQPFEKEAYIKAYPDRARQYYSEEDIRKFS